MRVVERAGKEDGNTYRKRDRTAHSLQKLPTLDECFSPPYLSACLTPCPSLSLSSKTLSSERDSRFLIPYFHFQSPISYHRPLFSPTRTLYRKKQNAGRRHERCCLPSRGGHSSPSPSPNRPLLSVGTADPVSMGSISVFWVFWVSWVSFIAAIPGAAVPVSIPTPSPSDAPLSSDSEPVPTSRHSGVGSAASSPPPPPAQPGS